MEDPQVKSCESAHRIYWRQVEYSDKMDGADIEEDS